MTEHQRPGYWSTVAGYYLSSIGIGIYGLSKRRFTRPILERLGRPVDYLRLREFPWVANALDVPDGARILDIGSPKYFGLHLARHRKVEVVLTDIRDYFIADYELMAQAPPRPKGRIVCAAEDGTRLSYADNSFDAVYSISVIEHIPGDGDIAALREMERVVRPGGIIAITVPHHAKTFIHAYVHASV